jgi:hypothetical protein
VQHISYSAAHLPPFFLKDETQAVNYGNSLMVGRGVNLFHKVHCWIPTSIARLSDVQKFRVAFISALRGLKLL